MTEKPSPAEMDVLKALWRTSPMSAREVHAELGERNGWSYSTTRTLLARMVEKALVERQSAHGLAIFLPAVSKVKVIGALVRSFSAQVFDLDKPLPASAFADSPVLDPAELEELEKLLGEADSDSMEGEKG